MSREIRLGWLSTLLAHMRWADECVAESLRPVSEGSERARELYAHVIGTEQVWLARILGTEPGSVWPGPEDDVDALRRDVHAAFESLVSTLEDAELDLPISYVNSAGEAYQSTVADILLHVFLHGAYHRGQVALLLRDGGAAPAPSDYIAFVRGAPAATRRDSAG